MCIECFFLRSRGLDYSGPMTSPAAMFRCPRARSIDMGWPRSSPRRKVPDCGAVGFTDHRTAWVRRDAVPSCPAPVGRRSCRRLSCAGLAEQADHVAVEGWDVIGHTAGNEIAIDD